MRLLLLLAILLLPSAAHAGIAKRATLQHAGQERIHYFYRPKAVEKPALVIALHGMGGNARNMRFGMGLTERAARHGFAVVYPQGIRLNSGSRHWNAGFDFSDTDDVAYLTALVRDLQEQHDLDTSRVYVLGLSMGGYMAYHMACHADLPIRAVASVAGTLSGPDWRNCPARSGASLLHIHGLDDPNIRFDGTTWFSGGWGGAPAVPEIAAHWAGRLGAMPAAPLSVRDDLQEWRYRNEATAAEVRVIGIQDYGHDWPSLPTIGYSAVDEIVNFFFLRAPPSG